MRIFLIKYSENFCEAGWGTVEIIMFKYSFLFQLQWTVVTLHGDHTVTVQNRVEVERKHDSEPAPIPLQQMEEKTAAALALARQAENAT